MRNGTKIAVVIPALNEEQAIGKVIAAIPSWVDDIVVGDNGSTDRTVEVAQASGARVVREPLRGYGAACLAGLAILCDPDVVVFLDGDFSDWPEEMPLLVDPILAGQADMVIGSRVLGRREAGALTPQARLGNRLSCYLIRLFWKTRYTDLGPFRAIRWQALQRLQMRDHNYGWTVEMQIKAARHGLRTAEVPVSYRNRIGQSKVSRTVKGSVCAGAKILWVIFRALLEPRAACDTAMHERLIVFTRYPEPGRTKTRLIPVLGPDGAAQLHRQMAEHCLKNAKRLAELRGVSVTACFEGGDVDIMTQWLGDGFEYMPQATGDLGQRMLGAFEHEFARGTKRVVLIGTDCPGITDKVLRDAFDVLRDHDLVLGPAVDGGYYLIGLRRIAPELFTDIPWSTDHVLEQTIHRANELQLTHRLLACLGDVDRPEDLPTWRQLEAGQPRSASTS